MESHSYRPVLSLMETQLEDELVILGATGQQMFTLNSTGMVIWQHLISDGVNEAVQALTERFEISEDQAQSDTLELLNELLEAGLIIHNA